MTQPSAIELDAKMRRRALVAIVFGVVYFVLGFQVLPSQRVQWGSGGTILTATGVVGSDSFKYRVDPFPEPFTGALDYTSTGRYPLLVEGWLGILHPGIPVFRTQISVTWRGDDGVTVLITSRQLLDKYVPLKSLPATMEGREFSDDHNEAMLQMLRSRQLTKWSIPWYRVCLLVAQAMVGVASIVAWFQWYRLRKLLARVEAGGCIKCGYPIARNTGTCPECGHVHGA